MKKYFICRHCHGRKNRNPRLKDKQHYCGSQECQQARKNTWELKKLQSDTQYYEKRKKQKAHWRSFHNAYLYQKNYRQTHPDYQEKNVLLQKVRYHMTRTCPVPGVGSKIVKTDTLSSTMLIQPGLYEIYPYQSGLGKKIVKTDPLIVQLLVHSGVGDDYLHNCKDRRH